jgi:hypothetical protein
MVKTGREVLRCAYPGCENEPPPGEAGAGEPGYCGRPDPVTGEPHTALTAFPRRQMLARQGGEVAAPRDPDHHPGLAFWRRRQWAEAEAREARSVAVQAEARLAEALTARADAEQEAEAAQARAARAERTAQEQVAAAQQERDEAVSAVETRAAEAESRAQEEARAARAELDRARRDADRQVAQARQDAARQHAELRPGLEAQIAAAEAARAGPAWRVAQEQVAAAQPGLDEAVSSALSLAAEVAPQTRDDEQDAVRAEHGQAELQPARFDRDNAAGRTAYRPARGTTSRSRRSRRK